MLWRRAYHCKVSTNTEAGYLCHQWLHCGISQQLHVHASENKQNTIAYEITSNIRHSRSNLLPRTDSLFRYSANPKHDSVLVTAKNFRSMLPTPL